MRLHAPTSRLAPAVVFALAMSGFGTAPLAGAVQDLLPDHLTAERPHEEVPWAHDRIAGQHLSFHYWHTFWTGAEGVIRAVDADGDTLMRAWAGSSTLLISDGYDEDGWLRTKSVGNSTNSWERADITLDGATYVFQRDGHPPVEARLSKEADAGTFGEVDHWTGEKVAVERERVLGPDARTTGFRTKVSEMSDWSVHAPRGGVQQTDDGHQSLYGLGIEAPIGHDDLTYVHTPEPEGAYVADASFRPADPHPRSPDGIPDHQAILAGLSGPVAHPTVDWAVVMASGASVQAVPRQESVVLERPGTYWEWSVYFIDSDGTRTQVAPTWNAPIWNSLEDPWHAVRVYVDPDTGVVEVQVDGNSTAMRFEDAFTNVSERIATGDVWQGDVGMWWTGGRTGYYDNLAVDPVGDAA